MREPQPDIKIPRHNVPELKNLIQREFRRFIGIKLAFETGVPEGQEKALLAEAEQCQANFNDLLDHFPHGIRRPDTDVALRSLEAHVSLPDARKAA